MPTDRPRIQVTLDDETSGLLAMLAEQQDESLSTTAASLIREALKLHEDRYLSDVSNERIKEDKGTRHSHENAWG